MHIAAIIKNSQGPRLLPRSPMIRVTATPSEKHALIRVIERDAAEAERELRLSAADHLTKRTLALREAVPWMRAKRVWAPIAHHSVQRIIRGSWALRRWCAAGWRYWWRDVQSALAKQQLMLGLATLLQLARGLG